MNRKDCSGLRRFDGEDLDYGDRIFKQQYQQKLWVEQQIKEKEDKKREKLAEEARWAEHNRNLHMMQTNLENDFMANQRAMEIACREANKQLIAEKLARTKAQYEFENMQGKNDIEYTTFNRFMTEDPSTTQSALAAHRVIPYNFKGFNEEQKAQVLAGQKQQIFEKQERDRKQKEQELAHHWLISTGRCNLSDNNWSSSYYC